MAHQIDSMVYTGARPWHGLGTEMPGGFTVKEALQHGKLDWQAELVPVTAEIDSGRQILKNYRAVIRTDRAGSPEGVLGVVSSDYRPIQNHESFGVLDELCGAGHATIHTAGALRGGSAVWMLCKLPGQIRVVGDDLVDKFFVVSNTHDGSTALRMFLTPIRVVCANTLNAATSRAENAQAMVYVRHTGDVVARANAGVKLLGLVNTKIDYLSGMYQSFAYHQLKAAQVRTYFERVLPAKELTSEQALSMTDEAIERHTKEQERRAYRLDRWTQLMETGYGSDLPGVRGTLWGAYNAVTQWVDHESYTKRTENKLSNIWFGDGRAIKERAYAEAEALLLS
jgi:phage/plasmid-like protein (TIGR03299 family)